MAAGAAEAQQPTRQELLRRLKRLAVAKQDDALLANFEESKGRSTPDLTEKELEKVVENVERVGSPVRAIAMLEARTQRFPKDIIGWVALARLHVRASQSPKAAPVWKQIRARFPVTAALAAEHARLLSAIGDQAGAYAALKDARPKIPAPKPRPPGAKPEEPDEHAPLGPKDYWSDLAHMAWEFDDVPEATIAYRNLWKAHPEFPSAATRLMYLLAEAGEIDEAIAVAKEALKLDRNPAHLLFAARLQVKRKAWPAAKQTLDLAGASGTMVASSLEYWQLRAEVLAALGDKNGVRAANRMAHQLDPNAVGPRAALLWDSIERGDLRTLANDLKAWMPRAREEREMWSPVAVGLDRIGRTRDAIPFYFKQMRADPTDVLWPLDLAEALTRVGEEEIARRLRRSVFTKLRTAAKQMAADPKKRDEKLLAAHAALTQELRGQPEGERWAASLIMRGKPTAELEEFAIAWYLASDRIGFARRHLARARRMKNERADFRSFKLQVALADENYTLVEKLLEPPHNLSDSEVAAALTRIERDDRAVQPLMRSLDRADVTGDRTAKLFGLLPNDADAPTLRAELRGVRDHVGPTATAGGDYTFVDGLHATGGHVRASRRFGGTRLVLHGGGRELRELGGAAVILDAPRVDASAGAAGRWLSERRVTEAGAGFNVQTVTPSASPVMPTLRYYDAFSLSKTLAFQIDGAVNRSVEDTSFLRIAGLRSIAEIDLAYEPLHRVYFATTILLSEDHTRKLQTLGAEVGGSIEAGYKIMKHVPEWIVGLRAGGYERFNPSRVPGEYLPIVRPREDITSLLPPGYQTIVATTRIARGDFFERARQERSPFPRYDCSVDAGYIFGTGSAAEGGGAAFSASAHCAVSFRVSSHGYVSARGEYIKGVVGIAQADNARANLSYTVFLR